VASLIVRLDDLSPEDLAAHATGLAERGREILGRENVPDDRIRIDTTVEMRYVGQYHEVALPLFPIEDLADRFHREHNRLYGYSLAEEGTPLEVINMAARAIGITDKPRMRGGERGGPDPSHAAKGTRAVWLPEDADFREIPVYDGHTLIAGNRFDGPAVVEQMNTTLFVAAEFDVVVDDMGSFVVYRRDRPDALPAGLRDGGGA
jgi:N-methylhydantoinase A